MPPISRTKYLVTATWDDAPHLSAQEKADLWESVPPHEREARSKGVPSLGAGAIYPLDHTRIKCEPIEIPSHWPLAYGMDVGWNCTACLWGAWDRQSDTVYIWSEYKAGQAEPATHVDAIKSRGDWIPGVIDPASRGRAQKDGVALLDEYQRMGLDLDLAENAVESGIHTIYRRMVSGRLKIFSTCVGVWDELRLYRRGEDGKVVKSNDHLMDCLRYLVVSGMARALTFDHYSDQFEQAEEKRSGANETTGY
jgi:hypothetical protein